MTDRLFKCRRLVGTTRCSFEGDNEAAGAHWRETGHARCIVCSGFLRNEEAQTCHRCISRARAALHDITQAVALAPEVIEGNGYRGILWDLLAYISDGSIESPVQQQNPDAYRYVEQPNDPWPVVAVLYSIERTWREEFAHGPRMTDATITSCANYLIEWLHRAATTYAGFDDDAVTLFQLASRLNHATGQADDPVRGVSCLDCPDVRLIRVYNEPVLPVPDRRRSADGRRGLDEEGKADTYECPSCKRTYDWSDYGKAVHHYAASIEGWVKISDAATAVQREPKQIWRWINEGRISVACLMQDKDRRARVLIAEVREVDAHAPRRNETRPGSMLDFADSA